MISKALRQIAGGNVSRSEALILLKQADSNATVIVWHDPEGVLTGGQPAVLLNGKSLLPTKWEQLQPQYKMLCSVVEIEWAKTELSLTLDQDPELLY